MAVWNPISRAQVVTLKHDPYKLVSALCSFLQRAWGIFRSEQEQAPSSSFFFGRCLKAAALCGPRLLRVVQTRNSATTPVQVLCLSQQSVMYPLSDMHAPLLITPCETFHISEFRMGQCTHKTGKGAGESSGQGTCVIRFEAVELHVWGEIR